MIYFIIYGAMLITSFFIMLAVYRGYNANKIDRVLFIIFSCLLFFLAILRKDIGLDFGSYKNLYTEIHTGSRNFLNNACEPLSWLLFKISPSFRIAILLFGIGGVALKEKFFYYHTNNRVFCLLLYYCSIYLFYDIAIIRQGIALTIIFYSFFQLSKNNKKGFFALVSIATFFHLSGIIALPIYFIYRKKMTLFHYILGFIISYAIFISMDIILPLIVNVVNMLGLSYIAYKLNAYTTYFAGSLSFGTHIKRIFVFFILLLSKNYYDRKDLKNPKNRNDLITQNNRMLTHRLTFDTLCLKVYYMSIIVGIIFSGISMISSRGIACLYYGQIFVFSSISARKDKDLIPQIVSILAILLFSYTMFNTLLNSADNYIPYKCILELGGFIDG